MTKRQPLHDRVIVQILPPDFVGERKSSGGIILPDTPTSDGQLNPIRHAIVMEVGAGEILFDGSIRALSVKRGDSILVHENEVLPLEPNYDPALPIIGILSERNILCIVNDT